MRTRTAAMVSIATLLLLAGACGKVRHESDRAQHDAMRHALAEAVNAKSRPVFVGRDHASAHLWQLTREFYQRRQYEPAWIDGRSPRPQMDELIHVLRDAGRDGLDPELYNATWLTERRAAADKGFLTKAGFHEDEAVSLDAWLTYLYLHYADDLANGLADLSSADSQWKIRGDKVDLLATLDGALSDRGVAASLDDLKPRDPQYVALRDALDKYRALAAQGGWPQVPATLKLKPGQKNASVPVLARRLSATGDYDGSDRTGTTYSRELQEAVKHFQARHGLEPDAIVGPSVVAELNVPADARVRQLELNLERWRWLPRDLGDRHILVNVPEYRLEVWDHGRVPLTMRVVVGKEDTPTPIFDDDMTYIVFAPYWNVPPDIVEKETLPSIMRDPAFLQRTNMEVVDRSGNTVDPATIDLSDPSAYRFRQRPGATNSLGLVKFMFPNQYNVYLHDTPADSLFARATRSFSHGCVRLAEPEKLAEYLLSDEPQWTPEKIAAAMHGTDQTVVKLREKIPVYLAYFTARVSSDGEVQFRRDVYGIDARQAKRLGAVLAQLREQAGAAAEAARAKKNMVKAAF